MKMRNRWKFAIQRVFMFLRAKILSPWSRPRVYAVEDGGSTVWVIANSPYQAIQTIEECYGLDYYYEADGEFDIHPLPDDQRLPIWLCDYEREDVSDILRVWWEEEEEDDGEWSTITINAPCSAWIEDAEGASKILADSEASC